MGMGRNELVLMTHRFEKLFRFARVIWRDNSSFGMGNLSKILCFINIIVFIAGNDFHYPYPYAVLHLLFIRLNNSVTPLSSVVTFVFNGLFFNVTLPVLLLAPCLETNFISVYITLTFCISLT